MHVEEILQSHDKRKGRGRESLRFSRGFALKGMGSGGKRGVERLEDGEGGEWGGVGKGKSGWERERERSREGTIVVETRVDVRASKERGRAREGESSLESLVTGGKVGV